MKLRGIAFRAENSGLTMDFLPRMTWIQGAKTLPDPGFGANFMISKTLATSHASPKLFPMILSTWTLVRDPESTKMRSVWSNDFRNPENFLERSDRSTQNPAWAHKVEPYQIRDLEQIPRFSTTFSELSRLSKVAYDDSVNMDTRSGPSEYENEVGLVRRPSEP